VVKKLRRSSGASAGSETSGSDVAVGIDREALFREAAKNYNEGRLDGAIRIYEKLCNQEPKDPMSWYLRGLVEHQNNNNIEAEKCLSRALQMTADPDMKSSILLWIGRVLIYLNKKKEAALNLHAGARCVWDNADRIYEFTQAIFMAQEFDSCEPLYARILELAPRHPGASAETALFDFRRGDYETAWRRTALALEQTPRAPAALRVKAHILHALGDGAEAAQLYQAAIDGAVDGLGQTNILAAHESMLGAMVYSDISDGELRRAHERWSSLIKARSRPRKPVYPRGGRPLRIGYVSPDFCNHAVSFFFEPLLHNHDESVVTPILYSNTLRIDEVSERMQRIASWRDITSLSDAEAADLIEEDRIDILVDLAGFTRDHRMGIFLLRPAPLQVNYLGYPCTTGLTEMDYRFTDEECDPLGETDSNYTEQLVRLPGGFYAWRQPDTFPPAGPPPVEKNGFITFGSLNTLAKITDDVVSLWSQLMHDVPDSRLILQAEPLANEWACRRILDKFSRHGIDTNRIQTHGRMRIREHLSLYNEMDVALDPFPWAGHTTTCLALFMSVPVVTLRGRRVASRMSASVLRRLGFDAWIAENPEQYLTIVKNLIADRDRLATLRLAQRMVFTSSDLMDGNRVARVIEAAYQTIWDHHAGW
jgi:predicted O-linked N-acetylglucosamine transferase (SPINDLY family)